MDRDIFQAAEIEHKLLYSSWDLHLKIMQVGTTVQLKKQKSYFDF